MTSSAGGASPGGTNTCGFSFPMARTLPPGPARLVGRGWALLEWAAHGAVNVLWGERTVVMKRSLLGLLASLVLGVSAVVTGPAPVPAGAAGIDVAQVQPADHDGKGDDKDK